MGNVGGGGNTYVWGVFVRRPRSWAWKPSVRQAPPPIPCVAGGPTSLLLFDTPLPVTQTHPVGVALNQKWKRSSGRLLFCLAAYALNLLPYIAVSRSAFLYHFMPALMYSQIIAALFLDQVALGRRKSVFRWCTLAAGLSFLYFSPWIYALPLSVGACLT